MARSQRPTGFGKSLAKQECNGETSTSPKVAVVLGTDARRKLLERKQLARIRAFAVGHSEQDARQREADVRTDRGCA